MNSTLSSKRGSSNTTDPPQSSDRTGKHTHLGEEESSRISTQESLRAIAQERERFDAYLKQMDSRVDSIFQDDDEVDQAVSPAAFSEANSVMDRIQVKQIMKQGTSKNAQKTQATSMTTIATQRSAEAEDESESESDQEELYDEEDMYRQRKEDQKTARE